MNENKNNIAESLDTVEEFEGFSRKILPFIVGIHKILDDYGIDEILDVCLSRDGYCSASIFNYPFSLSRFHQGDDFVIREERMIDSSSKINPATVPVAEPEQEGEA